MIEKNTVFVLGAGASCSYGFPNGEELTKAVVSAVERSLSIDDLSNSFLLLNTYHVAPSEDVQPNKCRAFVTALSNAGQASIDAFLYTNRRRHGFDVIGKGAIAQVLLKYEEELRTKQSDDDWLSYLFKIMIDGISSSDQFIEKNKVSFITFNYDCFLEEWLYTKIKYSFGLDATALEVFSKIPIHHVYGMLGSFSGANKKHPYPWVTASTQIKTIFDVEKDVSALNEIKSLLKKADVVCLLGFGFRRENIDLLDLVSYVMMDKKIWVASRYDFYDSEINRLLRPFGDAKGRIKLAPTEYKCLMAIKNLPIF